MGLLLKWLLVIQAIMALSLKTARGATISTSAIASSGSRRDVALVGAPPLQQHGVISVIHCVALCLRSSPLCSAVTLLPGNAYICQLHEKRLCDDPQLSLVHQPGAQYWEMYVSAAEFAEKEASDCDKEGPCFLRCCCIDCPPEGFIPPPAAYRRVVDNCTVREDFYLHEGYIYLPKWQEIATDGKFPVKKSRSSRSESVRFEVRVSKIAQVSLKLAFHYLDGSNNWKLLRTDELRLGTDDNKGIQLVQNSGTVVMPSGELPLLSTTEWFRIALICADNRCGIYGKDEATELLQIPELTSLGYNKLEFSSPMGVMSYWRMDEGVVDEVLMQSDGADGDPRHTLFAEGAFLRVNSTQSLDFIFSAAAFRDVWVEFREEYLWQADKVVRVGIYPNGRAVVAVFMSAASGSYVEESQQEMTGESILKSRDLESFNVTLAGKDVSIHSPHTGITVQLQISKPLANINYIGIGCDERWGAWVRFPDGRPGWSTLGWKEKGHGYSTGANLV